MKQFEQTCHQILEQEKTWPTPSQNLQTLLTLKTLIKAYFSERLQYDETPEGARKRKEIQDHLLELAKS